MTLLRRFASLRLTVFLFLVLSLLIGVGGIIEQGKNIDYYVIQYPKLYNYIINFHLNNIFHSYLFIILLILFSINILSCFLVRLPVKYKAVKDIKFLTVQQLLNKKNTVVINGNFSEISKYLKKRGYWLRKSSDMGAIFVKGIIGWFGAEIVHFGIILIIIGGIISASLSYNKYFVLNPGEETSLFEGYKLKLDNFEIPLYKDGSPKQYLSTVTLAKDNKILWNGDIYVNKPLQFGKYWIYQENYGLNSDKVKIVKLEIIKDNNKFIFDVPFGKEYLKDNFSFKCSVFISDFVVDIKNKTIYSKSPQHNNPAVYCRIGFPDGTEDENWIFIKYHDMRLIKNKYWKVNFIEYTPIYYSGLLIRVDYGKNIFFLGGIIVILGLFFSFYIPFNRIWVYRSGNEYVIGGISFKGEENFDKFLEKIKDDFK